jgi:hypothetical protein
MAAALMAYRDLVPQTVPAMALGSGFVLGALVYAGACLVQPDGRAELRKLLTDLRSSLPGQPLPQPEETGTFV